MVTDPRLQYWKCEIKSCKARVHTMTHDEDYDIIKNVGEHHHSSCASKPKVRKILAELKSQASACQESSRSLISSLCEMLDENEMALLPSTVRVSRNIRNWRQAKVSAPPIPHTRYSYEIPDEYKFLDSGELFLQFDSGQSDKDRLLVFATNKGLDDLVNVKHWAGDGTFKCSPSIFYQLYTLHIQVGLLSVPRLFALLPNKRQESHNLLFNQLMELRPGLNPVSIMMDFEKAHINSFKSVFQSASVSCCLFHLSQSVYRKVCEIGFKDRYHHDNEFSIKIRCFSALAFLPPSDVLDGFEELVDDDDLPQELVLF
ncbi:uncharacterized protein [Macrobrachium rosenbergii]|uniref:uncharacterized protein n=1 Tax=Macrobrachium rosenbergii TaxID=79674 RepID=UPI0034D406A1